MKQNLLSATRLTISCIIILVGIYPLFIWLAVKASVDNKDDKTVNNKIVVSEPGGKNFSGEKNVQGKSSAVNYSTADSVDSRSNE
jgi:hypothetical protein